MFGINNQTVVPQSRLGGLRQKLTMKKSVKPVKKTQKMLAPSKPIKPIKPVTGRKHFIRKHKNVAATPSLYQRIKMVVMSRVGWARSKLMITAGPAQKSKKQMNKL